MTSIPARGDSGTVSQRGVAIAVGGAPDITTAPPTTTVPPSVTTTTTTTSPTTTTVPPATDDAQPPPDPEPPADVLAIPRYTEKETLALTRFDPPAPPGSAAPSRASLTDLMAVVTVSRAALGMNILPSLALGLMVAWLSVRGIRRPEDDSQDKPETRGT